jgi:AbrB family looped-hinge helix DNA binding protein
MLMNKAHVSSNGQVSIPAAVRRRWNAAEVLVIDKGDRVIVRPVPPDPYAAIAGKYADAPPSEVLRAMSRAEDAEQEQRSR